MNNLRTDSFERVIAKIFGGKHPGGLDKLAYHIDTAKMAGREAAQRVHSAR